MLVPPGPLNVVLEKVELVPETAVALIVTHTFPPTREPGLLGPGPSVVAKITCDPFAAVEPPAARARIAFTSAPVHVPVPKVSKFRLSSVNGPPVRGPLHTRQVPTSMVLVDCGSRI